MTEQTSNDIAQNKRENINEPRLQVTRRSFERIKALIEIIIFSISLAAYYHYSMYSISENSILMLSAALTSTLISGSFLTIRFFKSLIPIPTHDEEMTIEREIAYFFHKPKVTAVAAFKLDTVPLRIRGKINYLLRTAYIEKISMFYFYYQKPVSNIKRTLLRLVKGAKYDELNSKEKEEEIISHDGLWQGALVIGTQAETLLLPGWKKRVKKSIEQNLNLLISSFISAFPHTKIKRLRGSEFEEILRLPFGSSTSFYFLGVEASVFAQIPSMIEKIIKPAYPAEFITPLDMQSDIILGYSFEMEGIIDNEPQIPIGFMKQQILSGNIFVAGDSSDERFKTNVKIILECIKQNLKYVIITTSKKYRMLANILDETKVKILRLGKDASIDVMSTDNVSSSEYNGLLNIAFYLAGVINNLNLSIVNLLIQRIYEDPTQRGLQPLFEQANILLESDIPKDDKRAIEAIRNIISATIKDDIYPALSMKTVDFKDLLEHYDIIIVEYDLKPHLNALIQAFLIIKILSSGFDDDVIIHLPYIQDILFNRTREKMGLDIFLRMLKRKKVILHASTNKPSLLDPTILQHFNCIVSHKVQRDEDVEVVSNLLKLKENVDGYYSPSRHKLGQESYLKWIEQDYFLLYRDDLSSAVPAIRGLLSDKPTISDEYLDIVSKEIKLQEEPKTILELEFGNDAKDASAILMWLTTSDLTFPALATIIDNMTPQRIKSLLTRLTRSALVLTNAVNVGRATQILYKITQKGILAFNQFMEKEGHEEVGRINFP